MNSLRNIMFFLFLTYQLPLMAAVRLPSILGENMVVQRDQPLPIWGWDEAGTEVTVKFAGNEATAKAAEDGKWTVRLPATDKIGPHRLTVVGTSQVELNGILVGEVWLCSGQSNMEWLVKRSKDAAKEIADARHAQIRHIKIPHNATQDVQNDVPSEGWQVCSPDTVGDFTAVGFFFGRHLHGELNVPVGLIGSNWGGTRIEPWTPPAGFQQVPGLRYIADHLENYPEKLDNGQVNHQSALALYNGMIHPLIPFAIRGVIWYQGESNRGEGMVYHDKMKALIHGWRHVWNNANLPFYFVQLAPFRYDGNVESLPEIWEAQAETLAVPGTGMAVTMDIGDPADIHPANKQDVGKRLALWALAKTYGRNDTVYSGPIYKSHRIVADRVHVQFDHVGGGLVSRDGQPLTHFEVAGDNGVFMPANAKIEGDEVIVFADAVDRPSAIRFAWHQEAEPNLSNKEGLPSAAFRASAE